MQSRKIYAARPELLDNGSRLFSTPSRTVKHVVVGDFTTRCAHLLLVS